MIIGMAFESYKERILEDEQYKELEDRLITLGGRALVFMPDPRPLTRMLIDEGQLFDTSVIRKVKGQANHCHDNVVSLFLKSKGKYQMVHGYGLSEDGLWRQHSWLIDDHHTILETTVLRTMYYGIMLTGSLVEMFLK